MEIRSFPVPFSEIVGPEAVEITFGPDDFAELRSLYAYSAKEVGDLLRRYNALKADSPDEEAAAVVEELLAKTIVGWHLNGPNGPIPKPVKSTDVDALPLALALNLVGFIGRFRGKPDPTPAA